MQLQAHNIIPPTTPQAENIIPPATPQADNIIPPATPRAENIPFPGARGRKTKPSENPDNTDVGGMNRSELDIQGARQKWKDGLVGSWLERQRKVRVDGVRV